MQTTKYICCDFIQYVQLSFQNVEVALLILIGALDKGVSDSARAFVGLQLSGSFQISNKCYRVVAGIRVLSGFTNWKISVFV